MAVLQYMTFYHSDFSKTRSLEIKSTNDYFGAISECLQKFTSFFFYQKATKDTNQLCACD